MNEESIFKVSLFPLFNTSLSFPASLSKGITLCKDLPFFREHITPQSSTSINVKSFLEVELYTGEEVVTKLLYQPRTVVQPHSKISLKNGDIFELENGKYSFMILIDISEDYLKQMIESNEGTTSAKRKLQEDEQTNTTNEQTKRLKENEKNNTTQSTPASTNPVITEPQHIVTAPPPFLSTIFTDPRATSNHINNTHTLNIPFIPLPTPPILPPLPSQISPLANNNTLFRYFFNNAINAHANANTSTTTTTTTSTTPTSTTNNNSSYVFVNNINDSNNNVNNNNNNNNNVITVSVKTEKDTSPLPKFIDDDLIIEKQIDPPTKHHVNISSVNTNVEKTFPLSSRENPISLDSDSENEVIIISSHNVLTTLAHARSQCPTHRFENPIFWGSNLTLPFRRNNLFCDYCYCYLCDSKAQECKKWSSTQYIEPVHCNAFDDKNHFTQMRNICKNPDVLDIYEQNLSKLPKDTLWKDHPWCNLKGIEQLVEFATKIQDCLNKSSNEHNYYDSDDDDDDEIDFSSDSENEYMSSRRYSAPKNTYLMHQFSGEIKEALYSVRSHIEGTPQNLSIYTFHYETYQVDSLPLPPTKPSTTPQIFIAVQFLEVILNTLITHSTKFSSSSYFENSFSGFLHSISVMWVQVLLNKQMTDDLRQHAVTHFQQVLEKTPFQNKDKTDTFNNLIQIANLGWEAPLIKEIDHNVFHDKENVSYAIIRACVQNEEKFELGIKIAEQNFPTNRAFASAALRVFLQGKPNLAVQLYLKSSQATFEFLELVCSIAAIPSLYLSLENTLDLIFQLSLKCMIEGNGYDKTKAFDFCLIKLLNEFNNNLPQNLLKQSPDTLLSIRKQVTELDIEKVRGIFKLTIINNNNNNNNNNINNIRHNINSAQILCDALGIQLSSISDLWLILRIEIICQFMAREESSNQDVLLNTIRKLDICKLFITIESIFEALPPHKSYPSLVEFVVTKTKMPIRSILSYVYRLWNNLSLDCVYELGKRAQVENQKELVKKCVETIYERWKSNQANKSFSLIMAKLSTEFGAVCLELGDPELQINTAHASFLVQPSLQTFQRLKSLIADDLWQQKKQHIVSSMKQIHLSAAIEILLKTNLIADISILLADHVTGENLGVVYNLYRSIANNEKQVTDLTLSLRSWLSAVQIRIRTGNHIFWGGYQIIWQYIALYSPFTALEWVNDLISNLEIHFNNVTVSPQLREFMVKVATFLHQIYAECGLELNWKERFRKIIRGPLRRKTSLYKSLQVLEDQVIPNKVPKSTNVLFLPPHTPEVARPIPVFSIPTENISPSTKRIIDQIWSDK